MVEFAGIPGPIPSYPLGNLLSFVGALPWETTSGFLANYGPICVIWFGSSPNIVINSPELFKTVLDTNYLDYYKDSPKKALLPVITRFTPFLANPPAWKAARAADSFSSEWFGKWLENQIPILRDFFSLRTSELNQEANTDNPELAEILQKMSFDGFSLSVAGKLLPESIYQKFVYMGKVGSSRLTSILLPSFVPSVKFYWKRWKWFSYFKNLIQEAEKDTNPFATDLIQWQLANISHTTGFPASAGIANVFYGGVYSVTSVILTIIWLLSQKENKNHEEKLRLEAKKLFSNNPNFTWEDIDKLPFLDKVIREAMRIYPPVPFYLRNSIHDKYVNLGGHKIPPNTPVLISNYSMHHSENHWESPLQFNPERWTKQVTQDNPYGSDYFFPFGRGPRACLGMPYALMYIKLMIASFYNIAKFEPAINASYTQDFFFGVMIPKGIRGKIILDSK